MIVWDHLFMMTVAWRRSLSLIFHPLRLTWTMRLLLAGSSLSTRAMLS